MAPISPKPIICIAINRKRVQCWKPHRMCPCAIYARTHSRHSNCWKSIWSNVTKKSESFNWTNIFLLENGFFNKVSVNLFHNKNSWSNKMCCLFVSDLKLFVVHIILVIGNCLYFVSDPLAEDEIESGQLLNASGVRSFRQSKRCPEYFNLFASEFDSFNHRISECKPNRAISILSKYPN